MPNIKSAIKRVEVSKKKTYVNRISKSELKTEIKKAHQAIDGGADNAEVLVKTTQKSLDQAAARGRLHKNTAARKVSRLARAMNKQAAAQ
ncbi:MAG: 30S ribosomal protein S20 [Oscillospiraceae bacterium]|nr:30S ribosomal protein S20 [Oscillospiraceae bacterium]MDD4367727.1 30S ribosomal protein S20 [Oscillospiraceae bacterium]